MLKGRYLRLVLTYDPNVFIHIKPNLIEGRNKVIVEKMNVATQQLTDLFRLNRSLLYIKATVKSIIKWYFSHRDSGCFC